MKKVLYYVIMVAIFIALDLIVCFGYAIANLKPGGILFYSPVCRTLRNRTGLDISIRRA